MEGELEGAPQSQMCERLKSVHFDELNMHFHYSQYVHYTSYNNAKIILRSYPGTFYQNLIFVDKHHIYKHCGDVGSNVMLM